MSSSISAHAALLKTVQNIQDRLEVEECLRDMLIDVEMSIHLQEKLQTHQQIQALQKRIQEQEYVIAETKAVRKETQQHQVAMADALMKELMEFSIEMGTLKDMKEQHEKLLIQYDEVVAKLIQAEEDRNNAVQSNNQDKPEVPLFEHGPPVESSITSIQASETKPTNDNPTASISVDIVQESGDTESTNVEPTDKPEELKQNDAATETIVIPNVEMIGSTDEIDDGTVVLVKEIRFDEFDKGIFLKIFSFLDALDILNTAQINVSMYSRVDSFFDSGDPQEEEENPHKSTPSSLDIPPSETTILAPTVSNDLSVDQSAVSDIQQSNVTSSININQPTLVALPPVASTKAMTTAARSNNPNLSTPISTTATPSLMAVPTLTSPPKHASSKSNDSAILNRTIFSLLQPRQRPTANMATTSMINSGNVSPVPSPARNFLRPLTDSITAGSTPTSANTTTAGGPLTMNATMANSMAAKLSDAELNAIILMTERLKQKEIIVDKLTKANEALLAKVDGTEGVKQFLINKVRDMEVSLSALIQNETKVVQQIASDQEVIAFLDGRVQELENVTTLLQTEKEDAKTELERIQKQSAQKVTVISDMLQFEREKLADQEREWKMTKKLLVKEVKSCRSQIIALQSERDGYREKSDTLRRALLSPSSSSSNNHQSSTHHSNGNSSKHRDRAFA